MSEKWYPKCGFRDGKDIDIEHERERIARALELIARYGGIDGGHHKEWVLDQVVRLLVDDYDAWVSGFEDGEDGPRTYVWGTGIAP